MSVKKPLRGEVNIPGDKSISHRSIMFGAIAEGNTEVSGFLQSADCLSTVDCFRKLGVEIDMDEEKKQVIVHGKGMRGLKPMSDPVHLYTGNSGTTTRIISGILAPQPFTSILSGDASINTRPMKRIMTPLQLMGADIVSEKNNDCAPLRITGGSLRGITYHSPVASAQVKSSILCAGLYADGETTVIEPSLSRDHTERMLSAFGAAVKSEAGSEGFHASILPCDELHAQKILVPGDISSAAYFIAAASIVPGSELLIRNVGINPTRAGILKAATAMGADISYLNPSENGEPVADLLVRSAPLHGTIIEKDMIPTLIDELPVIAVMASLAEGTTIIRDAAELKVKESDRIASVTENLNAMGGHVTPQDDGMIIKGISSLHAARIKTYNDHRIAMSFAIAALMADGDTTFDNPDCVSISYPEFYETLASIRR